MASPPLPPGLSRLGPRPFSFYPAILNVRHNQWQFRRATWSEVLVVNSRTGEEIWIPRHFIGEVSAVNDPVVIVGLAHELEYRDGAVWPYIRRVIEMPIALGATNNRAGDTPRGGVAPVVGIRLEPGRPKRAIQLICAAMALLILIYVLLTNAGRLNRPESRPQPRKAPRLPAAAGHSPFPRTSGAVARGESPISSCRPFWQGPFWPELS